MLWFQRWYSIQQKQGCLPCLSRMWLWNVIWISDNSLYPSPSHSFSVNIIPHQDSFLSAFWLSQEMGSMNDWGRGTGRRRGKDNSQPLLVSSQAVTSVTLFSATLIRTPVLPEMVQNPGLWHCGCCLGGGKWLPVFPVSGEPHYSLLVFFAFL